MVWRQAWIPAAAFLIASPAIADDTGLAPSCQSLSANYEIANGLLEDGNLLAVSGKTLADAHGIKFAPRNRAYNFFYVFQNADCSGKSCAPPILLIKTIKVTGASAQHKVYLMREGTNTKVPVDESDYADFHTRSRTVVRPYNWFHLSYALPNGKPRNTLDDGRRQTYVFSDLPAEPAEQPWLTARNYRFSLNGDNSLQCIPIDLTMQAGTVSLSIEIAEIENGEGADPDGDSIRTWDLGLKPE